jgi:cellulose synthase/poly-beta-1,6-N-acetylglucosamine synthase-like glycosyltransferase
MIIIISAFTICIIYILLIIRFMMGWNRIHDFETADNELTNVPVSIVVACKNEEQNIERLLLTLKQQNHQNFELMLVNDHSTDNTEQIIENARPDFTQLLLINATGHGKKNAIKEGILKAKNELIITTDADCAPTMNWLETIISFQSQNKCDLIICPVNISSQGSFFTRMQSLEFASLITSGAGAVGAGMPILCNAANMAFTKKAWLESQSDLCESEQSGDDIFLLQSLKKKNGVINFLKSTASFVETNPAKSLKAFFKQRQRWAAKSTAYTDGQLIFTSLVVFFISFVQILLFGLSCFYPQFLIPFLVIFAFKYLIDSLFLNSVRTFFQIKNVWINSFFLSLIYPFYIVLVAVSGLILKPTTWK